MILTVDNIAKMLDLSCVKTDSNEIDIRHMVKIAKKYNCGQVSVLHCFIPMVKSLLADSPEIKLIGNVSFPSGADSTTLKIAQVKELLLAGCDEIDVVMNIGKLRSGLIAEVKADLLSVIEAANNLPVKVIIECPTLKKEEIITACNICISVGASFIKTGTGWTQIGTTFEDVRLIKSVVGDAIKIKASGGIRGLDMLVGMYQLGAERFGVNTESGEIILNACIARGGSIEV